MKKVLCAFLIVLFVSGCSVFYGNSSTEPTPTKGFVEPTRPASDVVKSASSEGIDVDFYYEGDTYIYFGVVSAPTPCHEVKIDSIVAESYPEQVTINIELQNTGEICAQVIDEKVFSGTLQVSKDASITLNFNGQRLSAN